MLLEVNNVSKTYRGSGREVLALNNVTCAVDAGDFVAVRGPSGCGKTTLLLITGGLLAPDAGGEVLIDGQDPYKLSADRRASFRSSNIGFVFQQFHLIPYLDVLDNVMAPAIATGLADAKGRAHDLLAKFGMEHRLHHVPAQLSVGERQRTALARALLNQPKLILADEPTGNLDQDNAQAVLGYLAEFAKNGGGVLLVTHDDSVAKYATQTTKIESGQVVAATAN